MPPYRIVEQYKVTLPGIEPSVFQLLNREYLVDGEWRGSDEWRGSIVISSTYAFQYDSDTKDGLLQKAKEELSKRYPGATFSREKD
jgi:hypothetical protein